MKYNKIQKTSISTIFESRQIIFKGEKSNLDMGRGIDLRLQTPSKIVQSLPQSQTFCMYCPTCKISIRKAVFQTD